MAHSDRGTQFRSNAYRRARRGRGRDARPRPVWETLWEPVCGALRGATSQEGPIVDVGAGTGLSTRVVADACPMAAILAVEPSPVLRAVLLSRVASDVDLRERVTVVAADALGVDLPDRLGAVVAVNMIGHFNQEERRAFWQRVSERLAPGAPLVVNLQPPVEPDSIPYSTFAGVRVGRYTYEGGGAAEQTGPDSVTWRMRYRVRTHPTCGLGQGVRQRPCSHLNFGYRAPDKGKR